MDDVIVVQCKGCGATVTCHGSSMAKCEFCNRPTSATTAGVSVAAEKVAGIKTTSSAKAYIDFFFANFDWEEFSLSPEFTIEEIDILLDNIKKSEGDKPETWTMCFDYLHSCANRKTDSISMHLSDIVNDFVNEKNQNTLYNNFELLKENLDILLSKSSDVLQQLDSYINYAQNFGLDGDEVENLRTKRAALATKMEDANLPKRLQDLPEVKRALDRCDQALLNAFSEEGIDAEAEYAEAESNYQNGENKKALINLIKIKGYKDSLQLIDAINKVITVGDYMVVGGSEAVFYAPNKGVAYRVVDKLVDKSKTFMAKRDIDFVFADDIYCIKGEIVTCYENVADLSIFRDKKKKKLKEVPKKEYKLYGKIKSSKDERACSGLDSFILLVESTKENLKIRKKFFSSKEVTVLAPDEKIVAPIENSKYYDLLLFSPVDGRFTLIKQNITEFIDRKENIFYYITKHAEKNEKVKSKKLEYHDALFSVDAKSGETKFLLTGRATIREILDDNSIIFTRSTQGDDNITIYTKRNFESSTEEVVAHNVFRYHGYIDEKIFYVVGNKDIKTLYSIDKNGGEPNEVMRYMQDILFHDDDYIYTYRGKDLYTIYRIPITGGKEQSVVFGVRTFVPAQNDMGEKEYIIKGKLFYIDYYGMLCSVRLNGTGNEELVPGFNNIIGIKNDRIYYCALDSMTDKIYSLYSMESNGSKRVKHAYNIKEPVNFDADSIYYTQGVKGDLETLYNGVEDTVMQKKLPKIFKKLNKRKVNLDISCGALTLFDVNSQSSDQCAYDYDYPTKETLKQLKLKR